MSLILFYVGVALSVGYSVRFVVLVSGTRFGAATSSSCTSLNSASKMPIAWLLCVSTVQGLVMTLSVSVHTTFLCWPDSLIIYVCASTGFVLGFKIQILTTSLPSPFSKLCIVTSVAGSFGVSGSKLQSTEVSALQGLGVAYLVPSLRWLTLDSALILKSLVVLSLVFLLL